MKQVRYVSMSALLAVAACAEGESPSHEVADLILTDATIYTINDDAPVVGALAVRDGKILYAGDADGAQRFAGDKTIVRNLSGKVIFPGFTDSHAHLPHGGGSILGLGLVEYYEVETLLARVKEYADAHPDLPVIVGSGWELNLFKDANPGKSLLDDIVPDRPVFLIASDGHNGWANSKMLEMAGITKETVDPPNGRIERDANGEPSGTLRESAQGLVAPYLPEVSVEAEISNIEAGMAYQAAHGITATIDAAIMQDAQEAAYQALSERTDLPHRVRISMLAADEMVTSIVTEENVQQTVEKLKARRAAYRARSKGRLDAEAVKVFIDGVPENHTAALLEPYVGAPLGPEHAGEINLSSGALKAYATALDKEGFQVHMHAIGDRAVRVGLDAVETAIAANGQTDGRHHISHLEIVQPEDIARFGPLGVAANLQTLWHFRDAYITDLTEPFLQEKLHRWLYPAKSFVTANAKIVWGSDWPVSTSDPFDSIEVAVLRRDPSSAEDETWLSEEALSVDDMIRALTIGGAYLMGQDDMRGTLEVGKAADLIIVDADPYKISPEDISEIQVLETYVAGQQVFSR